MKRSYFNNIIENAKNNVLNSETEYLKLLKVMGNNHKYEFINQLSIYSKNPEATSCARYDFWKYTIERNVKTGEKGIPIVKNINGVQKGDWVFDVTQTTGLTEKGEKWHRWFFNKSHKDAIKNIIEAKGYNYTDNLPENIDILSKMYTDSNINHLCDYLKIEDENRKSFTNFIRNSMSYAISHRFDANYSVDMNNIKENFKLLDKKSLTIIGNYIAKHCFAIIENTNTKAQNLFIKKELTKDNNAVYTNLNNKINDNNIEGGNYGQILKGKDSRGDNREGGREDNRKEDDSTRTEVSGFRRSVGRIRERGESERVRWSGGHGRDSGHYGGENSRENGSGRGVFEEISNTNIRNNEINLYGGERGREVLLSPKLSISRERTVESLDGYSREGLQFHEIGKTKDDESLGNRERGRSILSNDAISVERDSNQRSSGVIDNKISIKEEVDFTTSSFNSNGNTKEIIMDEILDQEKVTEYDSKILDDDIRALVKNEKLKDGSFNLIKDIINGDSDIRFLYSGDTLTKIMPPISLLDPQREKKRKEVREKIQALVDKRKGMNVSNKNIYSSSDNSLNTQNKISEVEKTKKESVVTTENILLKSQNIDESKRLQDEINLFIDGKMDRHNSIMISNHTPKILQDVGLEDLPILYSQRHLANALHEKGENPHWHGLEVQDILNIQNDIYNPVAILESLSDKNSIIIVSDKVDKDNSLIIASVKKDGEGLYQLEKINSNYMTSIYGKEKFENYFNRCVEQNKILFIDKIKIQELECFAKLQLFGNSSNLEFNKIIHKIGEKVNNLEENLEPLLTTEKIDDTQEQEETVDSKEEFSLIDDNQEKELGIDEYYVGLNVRYQDEYYQIVENKYNENSISMLKLKEITNNDPYAVESSIMYTSSSPIPDLYAKVSDLKKIRTKDENVFVFDNGKVISTEEIFKKLGDKNLEELSSIVNDESLSIQERENIVNTNLAKMLKGLFLDSKILATNENVQKHIAEYVAKQLNLPYLPYNEDMARVVEEFIENVENENKEHYQNKNNIAKNESLVFNHSNEDVKNYFSSPFLATSLNVKVDEKDYNSAVLREYFKGFEFADGKTIENFNPFKEDDDVSDLINLHFFKNSDGEYRVSYTSSNSLIYNSELDSFIQNLNKNIEKLKDDVSRATTVEKEVDRNIESVTDLKKIYNKNFVITEEVQVEKLKPSERLNNNIEAIAILQQLEKGERELDINTQEVLAKYVGWGGLADVFDEDKKGQWEVARNFLKENLTPNEYENAKESTLTAFYTPKIVIDSIYKGLSNIGFKGGNILEPSLGIGNFIGNLPDDMNKSKVYGSELDSISGKIAQLLYPESNIKVQGFEETKFSNNFFDVAVGNVPFGEFKVADREYDKNNFLIHDYFFAKSIDKVRPGGVIAFITSSGTMDKKDDSIRRYIGSRCDLLGAIRLPNTTFKGVAGTEVTSDIIFLKKKSSILDKEQDWYNLATDENGYRYNKYFVEHPEMVLGNITEVSGRFGTVLTCEEKENTNLKELLDNAILNLDGNYEEVEIETIEDVEQNVKVISANDEVKNFSFTLVDDEVYYREDSVMIAYPFSDKDSEKIKDYIELTDALKEVIRLQKEDYSDEEIKQAQEKLNKVYDNFSKKHQFINSKQNNRLLSRDSNFPLVSSIEKLEEERFKEKGDIFFKRTITKSKVVDKVDTVEQALILSVSSKGRVDFEYMSGLLDGMDKESIINGLKGQIFLDINKNYTNEDLLNINKENDKFSFNYVTADEYLSGNIREKTLYALSFINKIYNEITNNKDKYSDDELNTLENIHNVVKYQKEKLDQAMPERLTASDISVRLGATWIPEDDIREFIFEKLKTPSWARWHIKVQYSPFTSEWNIEGKSVDKNNDLANMTYGTSRINAYKLIENSLNLRDTRVFDNVPDSDGKNRQVLNKKETMLASQKQELIKEEFKSWIFEDKDRRYRLENIYNERFNSTVNREYNGEHLLFEGININVDLMKHQKNAIARTLYGGNTLLAHVVGAGKTFEMVASAMESKRLGLCSKSLFVVPNHLTEQIGKEFMQLYPTANIMVAQKKDFEPKNRKRFIGRIATGEYDAIIIGHSQFEKIPMSKEYQKKHIEKQIDQIIKFIADYRYDNDKQFTVKQLANTKKKLEARLSKLNDDFKKDDVITFEELGVDKLFIDEAHSYKNLFLFTKMRNVAGISQSEAQKSSDMFMKCRYMDEITGEKGVVFATGTPVSNSMTELYTMQRYLQFNELEKRGLSNFDSWASTFGETTTAIELTPEGDKYRFKTRFSKFYNLPELMNMLKDVADIKTSDVLNLPVPEAHFETIVTKPTMEQQEILKSLSERADKVRSRAIEPNKDNMLKITNDGKKLALDQRLFNEMLPDDENSKVNVCIKNVFSIWNKTSDDKSTQLIFCDMSTPKGGEEFSVYDDIKEKLINLGIPKDEIAFIHDANTEKQKDELFSKVRKGEVRILLGSTQKCGAGTNIQDKLIALHDLDVPWRPSDLEQRAGRIIRQGNKNKDVYIFRYVTENTFDSYLWQTIENKQKFISQIMTSKSPVRVAEDVDETTLSYAEIKALATGNPLIKEKMDLETQVTKLRMLESNFRSNKYQLEDKIQKNYPNEIKKLEDSISKIKKDMESIEPLKNLSKEELKELSKDTDPKFTSLTIGGVKITNKKYAAERLIDELKTVKLNGDEKSIGSYRNLKLNVYYDGFTNVYKFKLKGELDYQGELGKDPIGNITRLDNAIDKISERRERFINNLEDTKNKLEIAKVEIEKPFDKVDELKTKALRLVEINKLLDLGDVEENENKNPKIEDIKKAIIDLCNREYGFNYSYENFNNEYPDLEHIRLAYTETEDGKHSIQFELNLKDYSSNLYVDDKLVTSSSYVEDGNTEKALDIILNDIRFANFTSLLTINSEDLYKSMGLKIDDEGNIYDPLAKDLDNDGIPDRYDNDFRDSDYFESVYDVDDNIHQKESKENDDKPSTLGMIEKFKEQIKENDNKIKNKEIEI